MLENMEKSIPSFKPNDTESQKESFDKIIESQGQKESNDPSSITGGLEVHTDLSMSENDIKQAKETIQSLRDAGRSEEEIGDSFIEIYLEKEKLNDFEGKIETERNPDCKIAIIIPAFNESEGIEKVLQSLLNQEGIERGLNSFEVTVVDNGSTDNTDKVVQNFAKEHPELHLFTVSEKEKSVGAARKRGMDEALLRGNSYIACTDADAQPDSRWISGIIQNFERKKEVTILTGKTENLEDEQLDSKVAELAGRMYNLETLSNEYYRFLEGKSKFEERIIPGANFAIRTSTYSEAGGMGKQKSGETNDLVDRAFEITGFKVIADENLVVRVSQRVSQRAESGQGQMIAKAQEALEESRKTGKEPILQVENPRRIEESNKFIGLLEEFFTSQGKFEGNEEEIKEKKELIESYIPIGKLEGLMAEGQFNNFEEFEKQVRNQYTDQVREKVDSKYPKINIVSDKEYQDAVDYLEKKID